MNILVVNSGSSSLKLTVFETYAFGLKRMLEAQWKGINGRTPKLSVNAGGKNYEKEFADTEISVVDGLKGIFEAAEKECGYRAASIDAIGHRFVHGGSLYTKSVLINSQVLQELENLDHLAPLHNPACFAGIEGCMEFFGRKIPQVAVFDTAFHSHMPQVASLYAIPLPLTEKYSIRRYGFHGISHQFLWNTYFKNICSKQLVEGKKEARIITAHLGNGCSITAIQDGCSLDTSMGFTPAEGLVMATRAGDIDAAVVDFLCQQEKKTVDEVLELLNFQSGLQGVSQFSSNMQELLCVYDTNEKARFAVQLFCYRIVKYIGAYMAILGGTDAIIFSGGIGENSPEIRQEVIQRFSWYGVKIDQQANQAAVKMKPAHFQKISSEDSSIAIYVIATDENSAIAEETRSFL
ncbi:MAG TPA: acetate/propionate family kinase [Chlamydiales bacterium]|nr:acetate/propionate family kinase [Chlamydiales bacterium]